MKSSLVRSSCGAIVFASAVVGCGSAPVSDTSESTSKEQEALSSDPGALIKMEMQSTVGVLLDEIPAGPQREAAANQALARGRQFWIDRALRQVKLSAYRLVFRGDYYAKSKGPLPLTPISTWTIDPVGSAHRVTTPKHDTIVIDYTFESHILADSASPAVVEPRLGKIGATWQEDLVFPNDPELILERTGYACMDEAEFPPFSVFEENAASFYDQTCAVETPATSSCHVTQFPAESCIDALRSKVGLVRTNMVFTRVPWSASLANQVRVGTITNHNGVDVNVVLPDLVEENRFIFRYFTADSCEVAEGAIDHAGWRKLLTFSASVRNDGTRSLDLGDVTDPNNPYVKSHVFEFSQCHGHNHFSHYGNFLYNGAPGTKRAFCLEDTSRYHNDEVTSLAPEHQSCVTQGMTRGWGDEYQFGLPGQWVDVTDVDSTDPHALTFDANADHFLCEGVPVLSSTGEPIFDPTSFVSEAGFPVSRVRCNMPANWHAGNVGTTTASIAADGSFVTEACKRGQEGPLRSCGFKARTQQHSCVAGTAVTLTCRSPGAPQVLRVCERSEKLGVGAACTVGDSVANVLVDPTETTIRFTCPAVRDAANPTTGGYATYDAPVNAGGTHAKPTCTGGDW